MQPIFAQQVIATVPAGAYPQSAAVDSMTNVTYVANSCGNDPTCASVGTVTVINGTTNTVVATVAVGYLPYAIAVNPATNQVYVVNNCGSDPNCASNGTVSVIDGASNNVTATVTVGSSPYNVAVNSVTNKIYVTNVCGTDLTCATQSGTVTAIDGATLGTISVPVGANPYAPVVNSVTNKIYVPNACGNDPTCAYPYVVGTVTVIDGVTNNPTSVNVGIYPVAADVDTVANQIYVANECGDDPSCGSAGTMAVIDGTSLATMDVPVGGYPLTIGVNSAMHKIYVPADCSGDPTCNGEPNGTVSVIDGTQLLSQYVSIPAGSLPYTMAVNSVANKIYVANLCGNASSCPNPIGTVTVIDGATLSFANVNVGNQPYGLAVNTATNLVYVPNYSDSTVSVINGASPTALRFVPLAQPCRAVDTRPAGRGRRSDSRGHLPEFPHSTRGKLQHSRDGRGVLAECHSDSAWATRRVPHHLAYRRVAASRFHHELV